MVVETKTKKRCTHTIHTSGALHAMLIWVVWLDLVVYVARPVEFVCCDHLDVPKSAICGEKDEDIEIRDLDLPHDHRVLTANNAVQVEGTVYNAVECESQDGLVSEIPA